MTNQYGDDDYDPLYDPDYEQEEPDYDYYTIYVPASALQLVPNAIEDDEWYGSLMNAAAAAEQLSSEMTDGPYKVYSVTIREEKYI